MLCPIASVLGGRHTWFADAGICILHLVQFPQGFETQDSELICSSFVRASCWSSRGWQWMRSVRVRSGAHGDLESARWLMHWREAEGGRLTGVRQRRHRGEDEALMRTGRMTIASSIEASRSSSSGLLDDYDGTKQGTNEALMLSAQRSSIIPSFLPQCMYSPSSFLCSSILTFSAS